MIEHHELLDAALAAYRLTGPERYVNCPFCFNNVYNLREPEPHLEGCPRPLLEQAIRNASGGKLP